MDSCVSAKGDVSPKDGSLCSSSCGLIQSVVDDIVPVFDELAKHSLYELELLLEDAKRYIYIAQMIGSVKPLKKAKQAIKKIKGKLKKQPHLKTKKIEVDLTEFHDLWLSSPDGPTRPERPELSKIKRHIFDILSPGVKPPAKTGKTVHWDKLSTLA